MVKNPPAMQKSQDPWVGKIPWRRKWQPVFLPGESPWTEESGGLQSMGSQRVGHDRATKHSTAAANPCDHQNDHFHGDQLSLANQANLEHLRAFIQLKSVLSNCATLFWDQIHGLLSIGGFLRIVILRIGAGYRKYQQLPLSHQMTFGELTFLARK